MVEEKVQANLGVVFDREIPVARDWIHLSLENKGGHWVLYRERRQRDGAKVTSITTAVPIRSLAQLSAFASADEFSSHLDKAYADILATVRASPPSGR